MTILIVKLTYTSQYNQNIYGNDTISRIMISGDKVECSLFGQIWLTLGPSGQKLIFFSLMFTFLTWISKKLIKVATNSLFDQKWQKCTL